MWRKQVVMTASADCLRYCAFILCSCMGFVPPKVVTIPVNMGRDVIEILARQVWHLQNLGMNINLRLYYELIPVEYHENARPEDFTLMDEIFYEQKTCLICVVEDRGKVLEIAALNMDTGNQHSYYHRVIKYTPTGMRERMTVINSHGIPENHPTAAEYPIARLELEKFLTKENPDLILIQQPKINDIIAHRWSGKVERVRELGWDERSGLYSYHFALRIKYATVNETGWENCPFHYHDRYDITQANMAFLDGSNNGYVRFISGYDCALFEVNEMCHRYKDGRLLRRANRSSEAAPVEE